MNFQEAKKNKTKARSLEKHYSRQGWYFIAASILLFTLFILYPIIKSVVLTFKSVKGLNASFVALGNYKRLFQDEMFWTALKNTFIFLIIQVPIMLTLAILLASMLNNKKLKFKALFRTAIFLPCVTSLVAYSVLFKMMFAEDGIINNFLITLNLINVPIGWLTDPFWAKVVIIIALTWRWTGYNMMFFLAGMQNIPEETYEAANIDGANAIQKLFKITIPQLKPIILFTGIMSTIGTLQLFDEPINLTKGGPGTATTTISQYIYNQSFVFAPDFGYAATISYAIVIIVIVLSIIQFKMAGDE
ncbi:carbohydrate ABC transporter permease [Romboutsia sp.]|uniref:carbohydrate ABC transporter permease n=1 Tax=Romboutsia sp. TaxID=1965302 RepID=UPI003F32AB89